MPREKKFTKQFGYTLRVDSPLSRRGTGYRHRVNAWAVSSLTGRQHKLVVPAVSPDKKFILLVGDSHLRAIADGVVMMPNTQDNKYVFGVMATPGASAADLRTEVVNADLPQSPDAVCLLAPSNNLTASRTIDEASADFSRLLHSVCCRWEEVCVVDFPPRLNVPVELQDQLRQEYHRVAASMGIQYSHVADLFSMNNLRLWSRDGVHLSDDYGMVVLANSMYAAVDKQLETPVTEPAAMPPRRPPNHRPHVPYSKQLPSSCSDTDMRTHISSRMDTCDQQTRRSHSYINFKIKLDTCQNKRDFIDYRQDDGYETPSKQPFCPTAVSPDLGCVMDYPSQPARSVAFNELELDRKKRLYVKSVIDHMNQRTGAIQGATAELHNLITHTDEDILTSSGEQWQHPTDLTRKNYRVRSGSTTPVMTLHDWQAKNGITYRRFAQVPKIFERSSYRP
ncbi:uncharacterized protein LOC114427766 [Parambassis ranga]|uniref:S100P-binding protein n=1 Tax=Parambassis ranga TaxID=210632 RepID=A0A6P7HCP1_9TELE|nr:S100P-binding protein [Parambassis ranga]